MILFGGGVGSNGVFTAFGDSWELDVSGTPTWAPLSTQGEPPAARMGASMVYDPVRDRMILFGGATPLEPYVFSNWNDVWELSLTGTPHWRRLEPVGPGPTLRENPLMVYDSRRDRMLVLGGTTSTGALEVWALSLAEPPQWSLVVTSGLRPYPYDLAGIYDPVGDQVVTFGGHTSGWTMSPRPSILSFAQGGVWSKPTPPGPWPIVRAGRADYDPVRHRMILHGGATGAFDPAGLEDTWALSLDGTWAWNLVSPSSGGASFANSMSFIQSRDALVVFGGAGYPDATALDRTRFFTFSDSTWCVSSLTRSDHALVFDPPRGRALVIAGSQSGHATNDVWELKTPGNGWWRQLRPLGTPPAPRVACSAIRAPERDAIVVFGGSVPDSVNDVWELTLEGRTEWKPIIAEGPQPPPRAWHSAVHDPTRSRMIVFGGSAGRHEWSTHLNDTWELSLTGTCRWAPITASGIAPTARAGHAALLDPARDRMIVISGSSGLNDPEVLLLGALEWQALPTSSIQLTSKAHPRAFVDVDRDRLVMTVDAMTGTQPLWEMPLAGSAIWSALDPTGSIPSGRVNTSFAYEPELDAALLFGGTGDPGPAQWIVWDRAPLPVVDLVPADARTIDRISPNPGRGLQTIELIIPRGDPPVRLTLFDLGGRRLKSWWVRGSGRIHQRWDGCDESGMRVRPGIYLARLGDSGSALRFVRLD